MILRSSQLLVDPEGRTYVAEIHGREAATGLWAGWIELAALEDANRLATAVETTQPDRRALKYWAAGLDRRA